MPPSSHVVSTTVRPAPEIKQRRSGSLSKDFGFGKAEILCLRCLLLLSPELFVEGAVLDGFGQMGQLDAFTIGQIRDSTGYF